MKISPERVARNEATFREANEQIFERAREYGVTDAIPFLCECAEPACSEIVRLSAQEYRRISEGGRFFNAPGHSARFPEFVKVGERHSTYEVVTKVGAPAAVAEKLDPCSPAHGE
jgi:hypothetical protein